MAADRMSALRALSRDRTGAGHADLVVRPGHGRPSPRRRGLRSAPLIVTQPIISVSTGAVHAVEALARFADGTAVEDVFAAAHAAGDGAQVEATCLAAALALRCRLPRHVRLSVNVSPDALAYVADRDVWPDDLHGIIVEVTEHAATHPDDLTDRLEALRARGAAIAIDDVSTGYAGLLRVARLRPEYVKVDRGVVSGIGDDAAQAAVLEALVTLSHRVGAAVIGEGVETLEDLETLSAFDVEFAQGFAVALPNAEIVTGVDDDVVAACRRGRYRMLTGGADHGRAVDQMRDVHAVTAILSATGGQRAIDDAITRTADRLSVDLLAVSVLVQGMSLSEIASTEALDPSVYALADYPTTLAVMRGGGTREIHAEDADAEAAEVALMREYRLVSLLLVPILDLGRTIGVLEVGHRSERRWSAQEVAQFQGLADNLAPVLRRLAGAGVPVTGHPVRQG